MSFPRNSRVIAAYESWRDQRLAQIEEAASDGTQLEEAHLRADFAEFLLGPIRKSVYKGYTYTEPQYRRYAAIESATNFDEHRIVGLNPITGMGYVGEDGDYPEVSRGERPPARVLVDTYGGVHRISRHAIVNDDMGELVRRTPEQMGRAMQRFITRALVSLIESNPDAPDGDPMFSNTRGNEFTAALSEDSIADHVTAIEDQEDDVGDPIIVEARTLVVNNARQQFIANRALRSQTTGANIQYAGGTHGVGTDFFDKGDLNPLAGVLPQDGVIRDRFFTDDNNFYVFGDPNDVPAFVLAFLNGQEQPFVGLKNPEVRAALGAGEDPFEFEVDNLAYKARSDFGVAPVDPRGATRAVVT